MKTGILADPASDWADRLWAFFRLDVGAYHGATAPNASYAGVLADAGMAQWIAPGVCENHFGYWHLPNVRLVYRFGHAGHRQRSYAIASLISWRGSWYVVHLGPNPRPRDVGTVALPADGPSTPGPAGGC
jgi:hypothetical protein